MKQLTAIGLLAGLLSSLGGCATAPKPDLKPASYLDTERAKISGKPQAIAGDACVVRDISGSSDFILRMQSLDISSAALASLKARLQAVGADVAASSLATACAGLERVSVPPRVAPTWERDAQTLDVPVLTTSDTITQEMAALNRRLVAAVTAAIQDAEGGYKRRALTLVADDLAALRAENKAETMWVLSIVGIDVSAAKSFVFGGQREEDCSRVRDLQARRDCERRAEEAIQTRDRFSYQLALVDLGSGEMVWFNNTSNVPGPPYEPTNYGAEWAQRALSPFYQ